MFVTLDEPLNMSALTFKKTKRYNKQVIGQRIGA
jgi:hypothetical protein